MEAKLALGRLPFAPSVELGEDFGPCYGIRMPFVHHNMLGDVWSSTSIRSVSTQRLSPPLQVLRIRQPAGRAEKSE
jgi:hypothetical protein